MSHGTIFLRTSVNSTPLGGWMSDLPNLAESESGSSYCWGTPQTRGSVPQIDAAAVTRPKTFFTDGRSVRSVCQQSSNSFHTSSERPISSAFTGFRGVSPSRTPNTASSSLNGSVPVST